MEALAPSKNLPSINVYGLPTVDLPLHYVPGTMYTGKYSYTVTILDGYGNMHVFFGLDLPTAYMLVDDASFRYGVIANWVNKTPVFYALN